MGCSDNSAPPRRLHLSLPPEDDLTQLGEIHPAALDITPDFEAGLISMRLVEPGQAEPLEIVLGPAAGLDTALKLVAAVARLREIWRNP